MALELYPLDMPLTEVIGNRSPQKQESNLSSLTTSQRELISITAKHLTLPSRTVLIKKENSPTGQTTDALTVQTLSIDNLPESSHDTDPLPTLHKNWMSVLQQRIFMSVVFFAIGFSAINALAFAAIGWLPLDIAAYIFVWPSVIAWLIVGILYPNYGKLALKGLIIGMLACFFYDCMRFTTIALGLWGDFIPKIGMLLLHTNKPDWVVGYIWRYIGDGGFMGVAFVVGYRLLRPKMDVRIAALIFGIAIWVCLIGTILLTPPGTLFALTPVTFCLSLLGHVIYGLSIGYLYPLFISEDGQGMRNFRRRLGQGMRAFLSHLEHEQAG